MTSISPDKNILNFLKELGRSRIFLLTLSSLLFALSFPSSLGNGTLLEASTQQGLPFSIFVFGWPLLHVLLSLKSLREALFYGTFYGFCSYLLLSLWLLDYDWIAFVLIPGIYFCYFGMFFSLYYVLGKVTNQIGRYAIFLVFWMLLEYLKSSGPVAYTYGNLLSSHYLFPGVLQFGRNFFLQNLAYLLILLPAIGLDAFRISLQRAWLLLPLLAVSLLYLGGLYLSGSGHSKNHFRSDHSTEPEILPQSPDYLNIALIQHNINSWQTDTNREALTSLLKLSRDAEARGAELIVWSETAFVPIYRFNRNRNLQALGKDIEELEAQIGAENNVEIARSLRFYRKLYQDISLSKELEQYLQNSPVPYLIGSNDYGQPELGENRWSLYNSILLLQGGEILATYHKKRLVPFTEEAKWESYLPQLNTLLRKKGFAQYSSGKTDFLLRLPLHNKIRAELRIYPMICYEDSLPLFWPNLNEEQYRALPNADILLSISNDSWSPSPIGGLQHLSSAASRAVETRRYFLRGSTSGQTSVLSPRGDLLHRLVPNQPGILLFRLPLSAR